MSCIYSSSIKPIIGNIFTTIGGPASGAVNYTISGSQKLQMSFSNPAWSLDSNNCIVFPRTGIFKVTLFMTANIGSTTGNIYARAYDATGKCYGQSIINTATNPAMYATFSFEINVTNVASGLFFDVAGGAPLTNLSVNSGSITQIYSS
jgi:hypothetical protein